MVRPLLSAALLAAVYVVFMPPAAVLADNVTTEINFDVDAGGAPIPGGTKIDSTYASLGVIFSSAASKCGTGIFASDNCLARGPLSEPNVVSACGGSTCAEISETSEGLVRADFLVPNVVQACIYFLVKDATSRGVIRAYNSNGELLAEQLTNIGSDQIVCVSAAGIARVEFSGYQDRYAWFDNFSFDVPTPVIPTTFSAIKTLYR